jgi:intracellular sulfur oxidation DsrE/DsrF family protein
MKGLTLKKTNDIMKKLTILAALVSLFLFSGSVLAAEYHDRAALEGVSVGKGIFLVDIAQPEKTQLYLKIIESTHKSLAAQGVKPDLIVLYMGPTVRLLAKEPLEGFEGKDAALASIASSVKALGELGVLQEVCAIATDYFNVPNEELLEPLTVVGNVFNSLIGYQAKGYSLIPIY